MNQRMTDGPVPIPSPFREPTAAPPLSPGRPVTPVRSGFAGPIVGKSAGATPSASVMPERPQPVRPAVLTTSPPMPQAPRPAHRPDAPADAKPGRPATTLDRDQILAATAECLDDLGLEKTTIRTIAKRLNCAVGSIYRYYTDKHELLEAVCEQRFVAVADAIGQGQHPDQTLRLYHAAASARPEQYRLMFWLASVGRGPEQAAKLPDVIASIVAGWARQLDDPNAARCRWALLHGQLMLDADLDCEQLPDLSPIRLTAEQNA